jgi:hypothetical protein
VLRFFASALSNSTKDLGSLKFTDSRSIAIKTPTLQQEPYLASLLCAEEQLKLFLPLLQNTSDRL